MYATSCCHFVRACVHTYVHLWQCNAEVLHIHFEHIRNIWVFFCCCCCCWVLSFFSLYLLRIKLSRSSIRILMNTSRKSMSDSLRHIDVLTLFGFCSTVWMFWCVLYFMYDLLTHISVRSCINKTIFASEFRRLSKYTFRWRWFWFICAKISYTFMHQRGEIKQQISQYTFLLFSILFLASACSSCLFEVRLIFVLHSLLFLKNVQFKQGMTSSNEFCKTWTVIHAHTHIHLHRAKSQSWFRSNVFFFYVVFVVSQVLFSFISAIWLHSRFRFRYPWLPVSVCPCENAKCRV